MPYYVLPFFFKKLTDHCATTDAPQATIPDAPFISTGYGEHCRDRTKSCRAATLAELLHDFT